jgi:hypothetical protein
VDGYPSREQDRKTAEAIQKKLKCEVLYTLVHDSDIFCYDYYRDGKLVDEFNSRPDYFEKVSARKRQSLHGKPEELRGTLRQPSDESKLRRLLMSDGDDRPDAHALLEGFAGLLDLPNAATCYGGLMSGYQDDEIERRVEFVHIPDLAPERRDGSRSARRRTMNLIA